MSNNKGLIRSEAQPTDWDNLNKDQKDALIQIMETMQEALAELPEDDHGTEKSHQLYLSSNRKSRISFIDGQRGTGKSTALITLMSFIKKNKIIGAKNKESSKRINEAMNAIKNRVVILEPIDMEPVPEHWNMLPAILARIEDAFLRYSRSDNSNIKPGLLDPSGYYHDAQRDLTQLQNKIAMSWDGNLHQRGVTLDPNAYAAETMNNERDRMKLNPAFTKVLGALAKQIDLCSSIDRPIFLLPIDDFDLNPRACLEMLRLLRMVSSPRLFTLVLGDLKVVDIVLNLKHSSNLNSVYGSSNENMLSVTPQEIAKLAGQISANALQKLLPTMQIVELGSLTICEALNYQPLRNDDNLLHELLKLYPIDLDNSCHANEAEETTSHLNKSIECLADMLLINSFYIEEGKKGKHNTYGTNEIISGNSLSDCCYSGLFTLNSTSRFIADFWAALKKISLDFSEATEEKDEKDEKDEKERQRINLIANLCRNQLLGDAALTPEERNLVRGGFFNLEAREWGLENLPLETYSIINNGHKVIQGEDKSCHFMTNKSVAWRFKLNQKDRQQKKIGFLHSGELGLSENHLAHDSTGILILFHDLLSVVQQKRFNSFLLPTSLSVNDSSWCKTVWQEDGGEQVELPWHAPLYCSFLGLDLFLSGWKNLLDEDKTDSELSADELAFTWISSGTAAIRTRLPVTYKKTSKNNIEIGCWIKLGEELVKLIREIDNNSPSIFRGQSEMWLISVALLIMPESGLSNSGINAMYTHISHTELINYWVQCKLLIVNHRQDRFNKICEKGMNSLASRLLKEELFKIGEKPELKSQDFESFFPKNEAKKIYTEYRLKKPDNNDIKQAEYFNNISNDYQQSSPTVEQDEANKKLESEFNMKGKNYAKQFKEYTRLADLVTKMTKDFR